MSDVLCIGAHPDDVEIGMGATVAGMVADGLEVEIVDLTDGEPTPHGSRETRARESAEAASLLGAGRTTLDLPNRELMDTVEARTALAEVVREHRPRMLFAPVPLDAHPDHEAASRIARAARFYAKFTKTDMAGEPHYAPRLFLYFAVHLKATFVPSFVVDAARGRAAKRAALEAYASQFTANPRNAHVVDMIDGQGSYWGALIGCEFGEPFSAPETIGVASPTDLR